MFVKEKRPPAPYLTTVIGGAKEGAEHKPHQTV